MDMDNEVYYIMLYLGRFKNICILNNSLFFLANDRIIIINESA